MAYTPPNTFSGSTTLTAADLNGNVDDLRVYLHNGISVGDIGATAWADTRHVQPPVSSPYSGTIHGVSGHQGGYSTPPGVNLTFVTKTLTGGGISSSVIWKAVSNSTFELDIRRDAKLLVHGYVESEVGPDTSGYTPARHVDIYDRLVYFAPFINAPTSAQAARAQEAQNHQEGWTGTYPIGVDNCFPMCAGYGAREGVFQYEVSAGSLTIGLAAYAQVDRVAIVSWGVAIEVYYL